MGVLVGFSTSSINRLRKTWDHDLAVVRAIADHVAVLYQGELCEVGTVDEVYSSLSHPYTAQLLKAASDLNGIQKTETGLLPLCAGEQKKIPTKRGCPFQRHCDRRIGPICDEEAPPWQATSAGHKIRCHIPLNEL